MQTSTDDHCAHARQHSVNSAGRWMKRCRARDEESSAMLPTTSTRNVPAGRWMTVQGIFKMRAHIMSGIVMDVAAFKVSHTVGSDKDATTLRAARAGSSSIGALDEGSRHVQKASAHQRQPDSRTRWCRLALPCPRWRVPRHPAIHEHTSNVPAGR
eukprot:scaffold103534_cov74-Phaeocystis_antarctica.AAC.2